MYQRIDETVSVLLASDKPVSMSWRNREYPITKIGLRHDYLEGKTLIHVFSVLSGDLFLKLKFNTKHLKWNLIETDHR